MQGHVSKGGREGGRERETDLESGTPQWARAHPYRRRSRATLAEWTGQKFPNVSVTNFQTSVSEILKIHCPSTFIIPPEILKIQCPSRFMLHLIYIATLRRTFANLCLVPGVVLLAAPQLCCVGVGVGVVVGVGAGVGVVVWC